MDEIQRHIAGPTAPSAVAAERGLLGIVLADSRALDEIEDDLSADDFYEPVHGRLWAAIMARRGNGLATDPTVLDGQFLGDEAYCASGGLPWLESLVDVAPGTSKAETYASEIKEAARRRDLLRLADSIVKEVRENEDSSDEVMDRTEAKLLAMRSSSRKLELISGASAAASVIAYLDDDEAVGGVMTGIQKLDDHLGPLLPGDLVLIMGRPSMGKSALAACIALNISEQNIGVIELNGEMSPEQMMRRHMTDCIHRRHGAGGPKYSSIRRRDVSNEHRAMLRWAQEKISPLPLKMLKRAGLKMSQVRSICRRQAAAWERKGIRLGVIIIDHAGLLRPDRPSKDRYADQTTISNGLKELADELVCPIIALNQMNRENEKREEKRPQLSDLRDSGSWEQDADFVIGCYREAYYAQRTPEPTFTPNAAVDKARREQMVWDEWDRARRSPIVEAIILKAREGDTATAKLWGDVARNAIRSDDPAIELGGFR
jgi:replicative DNA helicase